MSELVEASIHEGIGTLRLNRPEKRNAFSRQMVAEGISAIDELVSQGVGVATLEAAGQVFSAGDDISAPERDRGGVNTVEQFIEHVRDAPILWVAVVEGPVLGAAVALVASCPIVLCTDDAWFKLPERTFGVYPGFVVGQIAPVVGPRHALGLALGAEAIPATRAAAIGLVTETVPRAGLGEAQRRWLEPLRDAAGLAAEARNDWASFALRDVRA